MRWDGIGALLFDLDGTLVDSVPDLADAVDAMLGELDRPPAGEACVREWVGNGSARLVKRALTGTMDAEPKPTLFEQAMPAFLRHYGERLCVRSRLYPGVAEALPELAGHFPLAVVTNKPEAFIAPLLAHLGIAEHFTVCVGGDTLPQKKPDPAPLLHAAAQLGVPATAALVIGDSRNDVEAARRARMRVVCVPYGYNHGQAIEAAAPDAVLPDLRELAKRFIF